MVCSVCVSRIAAGDDSVTRGSFEKASEPASSVLSISVQNCIWNWQISSATNSIEIEDKLGRNKKLQSDWQ